MGLSSDEGSNVSSEGRGRLEAFCPYSIHVNDFAHMYNLIFKEGLRQFPKELVEIPTSISTHFNRSPQRRAKLAEIRWITASFRDLESC